MGYSTDFDGQVTVTPPLNAHEVAYLRKFSDSRRMDRKNGPYFIGSGDFGQDHDADIRDYNRPPTEQPGLWCNWEPTEDGTAIQWNGSEKFYDSPDWMAYLIDTFLKPGATVAAEMANPVPGRVYPEEFGHFTSDHTVDGTIDAQGDDPEDRWQLVVTANVVTTRPLPVEAVEDDDLIPGCVYTDAEGEHFLYRETDDEGEPVGPHFLQFGAHRWVPLTEPVRPLHPYGTLAA